MLPPQIFFHLKCALMHLQLHFRHDPLAGYPNFAPMTTFAGRADTRKQNELKFPVSGENFVKIHTKSVHFSTVWMPLGPKSWGINRPTLLVSSVKIWEGPVFSSHGSCSLTLVMFES